MNPVAFFDILSLLITSVALFSVLCCWKRAPLRKIRYFLFGLLFLTFIYSLSLAVEWTGISKAFDPVEDMIGDLIPIWWAFIIYAFLQQIAQEKLKASEQKFQDIANNIPGVVYQLRVRKDGSYYFNYVSPRLEHSFGIPSGDPTHPEFDFAHWIHPDDEQRLFESINQAIAQRNDWQFEGRFKTPTGEVRPFRGISSPMVLGEELVFNGVLIDMTESQAAEEELAKMQALLKAAIDQTPAGILIADAPDVSIRIVNAAALNIYGEAEEALTNAAALQHWINQQIFHVDGSPYEVSDLPLAKAILKGETTTNEEMVIRRDNGEELWVNANAAPVKNGAGEIVAGVVVFPDITDRKKAELELRERAETIRALVETSQDWIWSIDLHGVHTYCNPAVKNILGYTVEEIVGNRSFDILHEDDRKAVEEMIPLWIARKMGWRNLLLRWRHKDGSYRYLESNSVPILDADGNITGFRGVDRDITERKIAEAEIQKLNEELEERVQKRTAQLEAANRELESFSYSVSHDLRAPLRSIDGFSQALLEDCHDKLDGIESDYLIRVRNATQRMSRLIDDLLKLSRVTRSEIREEHIDLSEMADEIMAELTRSEPDRKVQWHIARDLMIRGDKHLIRIMMENLLGNAWKFTRYKEEAEITLSGETINGTKQFFVRDNGAGFDLRYARKLFGAFQRLHSEEQFEGTGIGLATVQRIINQHGGRIWAEAELGKGATFYFTLLS